MGLTSIYLYVDDFDNTDEDWNETGVEPWLSAVDNPNHLVKTNVGDALHRWFTFADSSDLGAIYRVKLEYYARHLNDGDNKIFITTLHNGVTSTELTCIPNTTFGWVATFITDETFFDSWTKINAMKASIKKQLATGYSSRLLSVDGYEGSNAWSTSGTAPWLEAVGGGYIYTTTKNAVSYEFTFEDLVGELSLLHDRSITLYCKQEAGGNDKIQIDVWDGIAWNTNTREITPNPGAYTSQNVVINDVIDTNAKANALKIRLKKLTTGGGDEVFVDYACFNCFVVNSEATVEVDCMRLKIEYWEGTVKDCKNPTDDVADEPMYDPWLNPENAYVEDGNPAIASYGGCKQHYFGHNFAPVSSVWQVIVHTLAKKGGTGADVIKTGIYDGAWYWVVHSLDTDYEYIKDDFTILGWDDSKLAVLKTGAWSGQTGCLTEDDEISLWVADNSKRIANRDSPPKIRVAYIRDNLPQIIATNVRLLGWDREHGIVPAIVENIEAVPNQPVYYLKFRHADDESHVKDIKTSASHMIWECFKGDITVESLEIGDCICGLGWNEETQDYKLEPYVLFEKTLIGVQTVYKLNTTPQRIFVHNMMQDTVKW